MKNLQLMGLCLLTAFNVLAQEQTVSVNSDITLSPVPVSIQPLSLTVDDMLEVKSLSDDQLTAFVSSLNVTPQISFDALPRQGVGQTYFSLQHPEWPPLPGDTASVPVWPMDGFYLLDDLNHDYNPPLARHMRTSFSGVLDPGDPGSGGGGGGTNGASPNVTILPNYGTNLWIAQVNIVSNNLTGIASNTLADVQYEIQTKTNLSQTNWLSTGSFILGSEVTNWTPLNPLPVTLTNNFFVRLRSWADDGSGLPIWWQLQYFGTNGVDPYGNPAGDGWNNLQKFQNGWNPNQFYTPPTPRGVTASYNAANGTATISWLASPGAVAGYKVTINDTVYTVSSNALTLTAAASNDPYNYFWDGPNAFLDYQVEADYEGGHSVQSNLRFLEEDAPDNVHVIPGPAGSAYLAVNVSALPPRTTAVRLTRFDQYGDEATVSNFDVPLAAFTNGLYLLPTAAVTAQLNEYDQWWVETIANGSANSAANVVSYYPYADGLLFPAYFDGRAQLKQNLIFQLRAATETSPFEFTEINLVSGNYVDSILYPASYVYSGFYQLDDDQATSYSPDPAAGAVDPYWPFHNNVRYRNFVFNTANLAASGFLNTGVNYDDHYLSVNDGTLLLHPLAFEFQIQTNYSPLLATNDTRWLLTCAPPLNASVDESLIGFATNASGGWTFASNPKNYWGLPVLSAKLANYSTITTLNPGGSSASGGYVYEEAAPPQFSAAEYVFWDSSPVPGRINFSISQTSDRLVAPVGGSIQVNGYAKLAVTNGNSGVYGYLGQYFDKAYKVGTNGITTTNQTGVLSPYGNFFATEPGEAALVTMPDVDTGQRGTGVVWCASMAVNKSASGNMDLSFNSVDATSSASPMVAWVNNGHTEAGLNGKLDFDLAVPPATTNYNLGRITCARDLENFFRLWLCGVPNLAFSNGYSATISCSAISGSPAINIYAAETNGGTLYLTDTNVAQSLVNEYAIGTAAADGRTCILPINFFDGKNKYLLFEGAGSGEGQFTLTIYRGTAVVLQTSAYIDLHDVKELYEQAHIENVTDYSPNTFLSTYKEDNFVSQDVNEDKKLIVLVHGWRMALNSTRQP